MEEGVICWTATGKKHLLVLNDCLLVKSNAFVRCVSRIHAGELK